MKRAHLITNEAQASAKLRLDTGKNKTELVGQARTAVSSVKAHPDYPNRPEVQQVTIAFEKTTDAVDTNAKALAALRVQEESLLSSQVLLLADMRRAGRTLVSVIDETTRGSADAIKQWGFEVGGKAPPSTSTAPPTGIRPFHSRDHESGIRWDAVRSHKGYELQIGDGTPQGWGTPIQVTRARYVPAGIQPGQKLVVRVAVRRTGGLSAYSDPVTVTIR